MRIIGNYSHTVFEYLDTILNEVMDLDIRKLTAQKEALQDRLQQISSWQQILDVLAQHLNGTCAFDGHLYIQQIEEICQQHTDIIDLCTEIKAAVEYTDDPISEDSLSEDVSSLMA